MRLQVCDELVLRITSRTRRHTAAAASRSASTASTDAAAAPSPPRPRYALVDIGANLTSEMYIGSYHGKSGVHEPDLAAVLDRAWDAGLERIFVTAGSLVEANRALALVAGPLGGQKGRLRCTVGVHPTRCSEEFGDAPLREHIARLWAACERGMATRSIVAIGECGLDYDRLEFCPAEIQKRCFEAQFELAERSGLPMFFHLRNAAEDFLEIVERNRARFVGGVVHSFDGTADVAARIVAMDLFIGINGCSLRSAESIEVVKTLPAERLLLETDAPWCDVRKSHAGWPLLVASGAPSPRRKVDKKKKRAAGAEAALVKGRNEPCELDVVLHVLAAARGEEPAALAAQILINTRRCFGE